MLQEILDKIKQKLEEDDEIRESTLKISRQSVRLSQEAVRSIHRGEFSKARKILEENFRLFQGIENDLRNVSPRLYYKGYVSIMHQEFVEASLLLALLDEGAPVQSPESLNISYYDYLSGLGDVVGELRRHIMDAMREGNFQETQRCISIMELIFEFLITLDYPEGLIPGIRRKTDVARGLIEKTKSDLFYFQHGNDLVKNITSLLEKLKNLDVKTKDD